MVIVRRLFVVRILTFSSTIISPDMVVLAQQGLAWPNSLTIELESGKLLWADASRKRIGMMNVDGTGMKVKFNIFRRGLGTWGFLRIKANQLY